MTGAPPRGARLFLEECHYFIVPSLPRSSTITTLALLRRFHRGGWPIPRWAVVLVSVETEILAALKVARFDCVHPPSHISDTIHRRLIILCCPSTSQIINLPPPSFVVSSDQLASSHGAEVNENGGQASVCWRNVRWQKRILQRKSVGSCALISVW